MAKDTTTALTTALTTDKPKRERKPKNAASIVKGIERLAMQHVQSIGLAHPSVARIGAALNEIKTAIAGE